MKKSIASIFASLICLALFSSSALAAAKRVTLSVPDMYCAVCPITVKKALEKVQGVSKVEVSLEKKEAVVSFDDAKASTAKLLDATLHAGYPAKLKAEDGK